MKINTPVKIENSNGMYNAIIESSGEYIGDMITTELAEEIVKRINLHDKLVEVLKSSKYALKQQYGNDSDFVNKIDELLEQCK